jgi:hypothetical protein
VGNDDNFFLIHQYRFILSFFINTALKKIYGSINHIIIVLVIHVSGNGGFYLSFLGVKIKNRSIHHGLSGSNYL